MGISSLQPRPPDPLLSIIGAFKADDRPDKLDLGVGIYQDAQGRTPIMGAIREAHRRFTEAEQSKAYLGPLGWPGLAEAGRRLLLGDALEGSLAPRMRVTPTPGGTGALRIAAEVVKRASPEATVWVGDPTWANHRPVFEAAGLAMATYPYYRPGSAGLDTGPMREALSNARRGDVLLLHGCCHNPAGEDLTAEDWEFVAGLAVANGALPLVDIAYHGLGDGLEADLDGCRQVLAAVPEALVCYSFSKNMGLYRDRVGLVAVMGESETATAAIQTHVLDTARRNYSMPPTYGEALACFTLTEADLRAQWTAELEAMRRRVVSLRQGAAEALGHRFGDDRFRYIAAQKGMFSMLPLSPSQVTELRQRFAVYLAPDGRINICGLPTEKAPHLADCVAQVTGR